MENSSEEVPLGQVKIGVTYNLKHTESTAEAAPDAQAEYDSMDTVLAIAAAIRSCGHRTILLEADAALPQKLMQEKPDLVFNIAEGGGGRAREAQVPALLELLKIPYTGSDATALCVSLDKSLTKRVLASFRIPTPRFRLYSQHTPVRATNLRFPLIVKPNAEGSSKGIADVCIAENSSELKKLVQANIDLYGGDVLVEEFIPGREFTVGLLGNGATLRVFPPMEIVYHRSPIRGYNVYNYTVKQEYQSFVSYQCPAQISKQMEQEMIRLSETIFCALGCRDFARIDFRADDAGKLYFIEINPLPGLAPHYSDFPMLAEFCGVSHESLVCEVLRAGAERAGIRLS